jgi:Plasmid replication region DNA-binding N-term
LEDKAMRKDNSRYIRPVTEEEVHAAADYFDKAGERPSERGVRDFLKGGAFKTIRKYLKSWYDKVDETPDAGEPPAGLNSTLSAFARRFWSEAVAAADEKVREVTAQKDLLQKDLDKASALADGYALENDEKSAKIAEQANFIELGIRREKRLAKERDRANGKVAALEAALNSARSKPANDNADPISNDKPQSKQAGG